MVAEKILNIGDKVSLRTKDKTWKGIILESYSSEVILLKLDSGYNIGIREKEILDLEVIEKSKETKKTEHKIPKDPELRDIAIIITGGTISARLDPKTGGVISTDAEEVLKMASGIEKICNITRIEKPLMKFSENMSFNDWKILAQTCETLANDEKIAGIIITHGTDFLHYTSSALSFMLGKLNKPIALTYSQRSIDRGSTDASLNLICAAKYAVSDIAEVALIGHKNLEDESCLAMPGTKVRKMHTSRRDAFKVINSEPLAEISKKELKILRNFNARDNKRKIKANTSYTDKVALIKVYPGQDPEILEHYAEKEYKGIILEIAGIGQVPSQDAKHNFLPTIKRLTEKGIIICGTAQTINGGLNPNVYSTGRDLQKAGLIHLKDMLSETAFIKLSWLLGQKTLIKFPEKIKEKMLENLAGEFNESLGFNF